MAGKPVSCGKTVRKDVFDKASVGSVLAKHVYVGNLCPTDVGVLAKRKELVHRSRPCLSGENNYVICRTVEFDIRPFWGAFKIRRLRSKSAYHSISLAMMQYIYIYIEWPSCFGSWFRSNKILGQTMVVQ